MLSLRPHISSQIPRRSVNKRPSLNFEVIFSLKLLGSSTAHGAGSEQEGWIVQQQPYRKSFCNSSTTSGSADALHRKKFINSLIAQQV